MENMLTLNNSTSDTDAYLFASVAVFCFVFYGIQSLVYAVTSHNVEISYLVEQFTDIAMQDNLKSVLEPTLYFNNLTNKLSDVMSPELTEKMTLNKNSVHFYILHGSAIRYVLFTVNENGSLNIHAEALVDRHTIATDLAIMKTQFNTILSALTVLKGGPFDLKISIFISGQEDLFLVPRVFLPITDFMLTNPCSLFHHAFTFADPSRYISNIANNLPLLAGDIQLLTIWCNRTYDTLMNISYTDEHTATNGWSYVQTTNQLIRYLESIYNVYDHIQAIDTHVSRTMEED